MTMRLLAVLLVVFVTTGCAAFGQMPEGPRQRLGQRTGAGIAAGVCGGVGALAAGLATGEGGAALLGGLAGALVCGVIGAAVGEIVGDSQDPVALCEYTGYGWEDNLYGMPCKWDPGRGWVPDYYR